MSETTTWEYRVQTFGSAWSGAKDEELEALLNAWGDEGWEVILVEPITNSNKVRVVARRPVTRSTRRERSWPGS